MNGNLFMQGIPTSFNVSNIHKSMCFQKVKLSATVLNITYDIFLFIKHSPWHLVREPWYNRWPAGDGLQGSECLS